MYIRKRTAELKKGDRVMFDDVVEEVMSISEAGAFITNVTSTRHFKDGSPSKPSWFQAGSASWQFVEVLDG